MRRKEREKKKDGLNYMSIWHWIISFLFLLLVLMYNFLKFHTLSPFITSLQILWFNDLEKRFKVDKAIGYYWGVIEDVEWVKNRGPRFIWLIRRKIRYKNNHRSGRFKKMMMLMMMLCIEQKRKKKEKIMMMKESAQASVDSEHKTAKEEGPHGRWSRWCTTEGRRMLCLCPIFNHMECRHLRSSTSSIILSMTIIYIKIIFYIPVIQLAHVIAHIFT